MPRAEKHESDFELPAEGWHVAQFNDAKEERVLSPYSTESDGKRAVWFWEFLSTQLQRNGEPQRISQMTDARLTPKNSQIKFWEMLVPGITFETCDGDTTPYVGMWYAINVRHTEHNGKIRAQIAFIEAFDPARHQHLTHPQPVAPQNTYPDGTPSRRDANRFGGEPSMPAQTAQQQHAPVQQAPVAAAQRQPAAAPQQGWTAARPGGPPTRSYAQVGTAAPRGQVAQVDPDADPFADPFVDE